MSPIETYPEGFQTEEFEILVYITDGWGGAVMYEGHYEVTSYFPAMVDLRTGKMIEADGRIENLIKSEDYKADQYYHFENKCIYRLLVSKCIEKELGPGIMASMNNRYHLKKVIAANVESPELEAFRAEYEKSVIMDVCGNEFVLNRKFGWYEGNVEILGGSCLVYLDLDEQTKVEAKDAAARFEIFLKDIENLDRQMKDFCVERMLDSANEWKENEDDPDITPEQFKENLDSPNELVVHNDGSAEFMYGDGDMFGGHAIQVSVEADGELSDCELVG